MPYKAKLNSSIILLGKNKVFIQKFNSTLTLSVQEDCY